MNLTYYSAYPHNDSYKQRLHHIIPYLKKKFQNVTIITGIMPIKDRLFSILKNPSRIFFPEKEIIENVCYITVYPLVPNKIAFRFPLLFKLNHLIIYWQTARYTKASDAMGTCHPFMYTGTIKKIPAQVKFYDCPDIYEDFPWALPEVSIRLEKEIVSAVDVCFGSSKFICKIKTDQFGKNFLPVLNAVDYEYHHKITENAHVHQNSLQKVLYVGSLAEWFDYDLLEELLKKFRAQKFILVGGPSPATATRLQDLIRKYQNLEYLGLRNYSEIPGIIKASDVGIIPFKKSKLIDGVSPLKFFEYAAHGLPVVSTRWKELQDFESSMYLCDTQNEFIESLKIALSVGKQDSIKKVAFENSWNRRVDQMMSALKSKLDQVK